MSKMIRVNEITHKVLTETSRLTGMGIGEIVDLLVRDKASKDVVKELIARMKKDNSES